MRTESCTFLAVLCTATALVITALGGTNQPATLNADFLEPSPESAGALAGSRHDGASLERWVSLLHPARAHTNDYEQRAILQMGTNALPFLLEWVAYYEPGGPSRYLPSVATREVVQRYRLAANAELAFGVLGPIAVPALPALSNLVATSRESAGRALGAMGKIGVPALPYLLPILTNGPAYARSSAVAALAYLPGTNVLRAVPALIQALTNNPASYDSMKVLGFLASGHELEDPQAVAEAFTNAATVNPALRDGAIRILSLFGEDAYTALPFLLHSLHDPDEGIRRTAVMTIRRVAPHLLTNAPPP